MQENTLGAKDEMGLQLMHSERKKESRMKGFRR